MYVANIPPEAEPSVESDETDDAKKEASESAEAIARVALAHADKVNGLRRDYRVSSVAACLTVREGQETLGAKVRYVRTVLLILGQSTTAHSRVLWSILSCIV